MFKILLSFQINNMSHSLETEIQVVTVMAEYESPVIVICELRCRGTTNIPERHPITSIYQKSLETGSTRDCVHRGRPPTSKSLVHAFLKMKQSIDKIIFNA